MGRLFRISVTGGEVITQEPLKKANDNHNNGHWSLEEDEQVQRDYIQSLIKKSIPLPSRPYFNEAALPIIEQAEDKARNKYVTSRDIGKFLEQGLKEIGLEHLLKDLGPLVEPVQIDEIPPLAPEVKAYEENAHKASPTLDAIIQFLEHWCTRSYEFFNVAAALWVLSTIAARRVQIKWRKGVWTPFYFLLTSPSTAYAKSEAASYAEQIIKDCGLEYLLSPNEFSPQKLMSNMASLTIPSNYELKDKEGKEFIRLKAAFSAQKGWIYDEFGNKLQNIINSRGNDAVFYQLLKQLYDCKPTYIYDTVSRGAEEIVMPYLCIIGTATPSCLKPIVTKHSAVFDDGMFSRISFIVPPRDTYKIRLAPNEKYIAPYQIIQSLIKWHRRLGIPECEIVNTHEQEELLKLALGSDKKKLNYNLPLYNIQKGNLPQKEVTMPDDVYKAFEAYSTEMIRIANEPTNNLDERFKSAYNRFPEKALRIAALLASLDNNEQMDMRHWGRGQQIAEQLRRDYHELIAQLYSDESPSSYGEIEDLIIRYLTKKQPGVYVQPRELRDNIRPLKKIGTPEIRKMCNELVDADPKNYLRDGTGKDVAFALKVGAKK